MADEYKIIDDDFITISKSEKEYLVQLRDNCPSCDGNIFSVNSTNGTYDCTFCGTGKINFSSLSRNL